MGRRALSPTQDPQGSFQLFDMLGLAVILSCCLSRPLPQNLLLAPTPRITSLLKLEIRDWSFMFPFASLL